MIYWLPLFNIIIFLLWLCKHKRKSPPNPKDKRKNNREIRKLHRLSSNKENSVELLTKLKEINCSKGSNNMKLIILKLSKIKSLLVEMLRLMAKFMFQLLPKLLLLLELGVSTNLIPAVSEFWDFSDLDNSTMELLWGSTKLPQIF